MSTTIDVNKKTVKELLESGKKQRFVIPEYQRPYAWSEDQIQTLFDDLAEFTENLAANKDEAESTYFLGSVVSYENNKEQEIIDGQQRITSLFLLLRALYTKLESMSDSDERNNFIGEIQPALWKKNPMTGKVDFDSTLIVSHVMGDEGNEIFSNILKSGKVGKEAKDNYSKNYSQLLSLVEEYASKEPELFFRFIFNLLNQVILLPITADSQETALTIFSTLNDRGLALSDADIFKAKIYNHLDDELKAVFVDNWTRISDEAIDANESIQKLLYYYMFYLRAKEDDRKTTTPGIRKYYSKNRFERLYDEKILNDLEVILNFWIVVNKHNSLGDETWSTNSKILKLLDILSSYPNEFWKYPVITYYITYRNEADFEALFLEFIKKLTANLTARYIITPTINAVKTSILNLNAEIIKSSEPRFDFSEVDEEEFKDKIKNTHRNMVRLILKFMAYQEQDELLQDKWEIEHILPQKWQSSFFSGHSEKEVKELVEHIGNKVPFEKKLNIKASNGYFEQKVKHYENSKIQIVNDLAAKSSDWTLDDIRERDFKISELLWDKMLDWGLNSNEIENGNSHSINIPRELLERYEAYLKALSLDDTDTSRSQFIKITKN